MKNIFLIGPMGAGKSTIGKILATNLHKNFLDTDIILEQNTGTRIHWIFTIENEIGFRIRESKILNIISIIPNTIIATGGGIVLLSKNRKILKERGIVIYLKINIENQINRVFNTLRYRPLIVENNILYTANVLRNIDKLRNPIYEKIADIIIYNDNNNIKFVVNKLLLLLKNKL